LNTKREDHEQERLEKLASDAAQNADQARLVEDWQMRQDSSEAREPMLQGQRDKLEQVLNTKREDHKHERLEKLASDAAQNADHARLAEDWQMWQDSSEARERTLEGQRDVLEQDLKKERKQNFLMAQQNSDLVEQSIEDRRKAEEKSAVDERNLRDCQNKLMSTKWGLQQALSANEKLNDGHKTQAQIYFEKLENTLVSANTEPDSQIVRIIKT
jgi:hypothetical protein